MATEKVLEALNELGVEQLIRKPLDNILKMSQSIALESPSTRIK